VHAAHRDSEGYLNRKVNQAPPKPFSQLTFIFALATDLRSTFNIEPRPPRKAITTRPEKFPEHPEDANLQQWVPGEVSSHPTASSPHQLYHAVFSELAYPLPVLTPSWQGRGQHPQSQH
jgi:hypothetical protein